MNSFSRIRPKFQGKVKFPAEGIEESLIAILLLAGILLVVIHWKSKHFPSSSILPEICNTSSFNR
jgi:hypothetical protein